MIGDGGAKAFAVTRPFHGGGAAHVFADGDIFHFGRDDAAPGIGQLGDGGTGTGAKRGFDDVGEFGNVGLAAGDVDDAVILRLHLAAGVALHIAARFDPGGAQRRQAGGNVDPGAGIGVGAGGIIDAHRRFVGGSVERDFAHGDADIGVDDAGDMDLAAAGQRAGGDRHFELGIDIGHGVHPSL